MGSKSREWNDISSWSKGDKDRTPKTWGIELGRFYLTVTRHRDYEPGQWLCSFERSLFVLKSEEIEAAKAEAIRWFRSQMQTALDESAEVPQ